MTITDEDIYEFLDHAGVKGMKWGVRKASAPPTSQAMARRQAFAEEQRKAKRKERLITGAAVLAGGLLIANQILASNRKKQLREISQATNRKNAAKAAQLFGSVKSTPMSQIVRTGFAVGPSGAASPIFKRVVAR